MTDTLRKVLKRLLYPLEIMLTCVRWYVAYPLSQRHIEEMMHERGVFGDHTTIPRRALKILPVLALAFRRRKPLVGSSWRICARILLAGIETMHMIKKGQLDCPDGQVSSAADPFYSLAA